MTDGFIYCFSNPSMPGILKIGMTERTPETRLSEANVSDTWRPPTPYVIELAKKVNNAKTKEKILHTLLEQYTVRINPRREFFKVSIEEIKTFFELMDGEIWTPSPDNETIEPDEIEDEHSSETFSDSISPTSHSTIRGCREMIKCFTNGQRIRHTIGINKTWIGIYDSLKNGIVFGDKFFKSLSGFAQEHYSIDRPDRCKYANGWKECECEVDDKWISTFLLQPLS